MGCAKLSLPLGNTTLGSCALETAVTSSLDQIIVITQENDSLSWLPPHFFSESYKQKWKQQSCTASLKGQAESIKCGLSLAQKMKAEAIMILLADQPFVTRQIIDQMILLFQEKEPPYIASCFHDVISPPVLFHSTLFPALFQLKGDEGARKMIKRNQHGLLIPVTDQRSLQDIDTPEQYLVFRSSF